VQYIGDNNTRLQNQKTLNNKSGVKMSNGSIGAFGAIAGGLMLIGIGFYALTSSADSAVHDILGWPFIFVGIVVLIFGLGILFKNRPE
jgi:sulfite exporter TauE/SafE